MQLGHYALNNHSGVIKGGSGDGVYSPENQSQVKFLTLRKTELSQKVRRLSQWEVPPAPTASFTTPLNENIGKIKHL